MSLVLHESAEMYLETIYLLQQRSDNVRAVDIAAEMGFSKPTISEWMGKLKKEGLISAAANGSIILSEHGEKIAQSIYERHTVLNQIFQLIGVSPDVAVHDACRIEHYISDETFKCLKVYFADALKDTPQEEDESETK